MRLIFCKKKVSSFALVLFFVFIVNAQNTNSNDIKADSTQPCIPSLKLKEAEYKKVQLIIDTGVKSTNRTKPFCHFYFSLLPKQ